MKVNKRISVSAIAVMLLIGGAALLIQHHINTVSKPVGLAFYINGKGNMLASAAVVGRCKPDTITIQNSQGHSIPATITAYSDDYGLASLSTNRRVDNFASIGLTSDGVLLKNAKSQSLFSALYKEDAEGALVKSIAWGTIESVVTDRAKGIEVEIGLNALSRGGVVLGMDATLIGLIAPESLPTQADAPMQTRASIVGVEAIVKFAKENELEIIYWKNSTPKRPPEILVHADRVTGLVSCKQKLSLEGALNALQAL